MNLDFGTAVRVCWYDSAHEPGWLYGEYEGQPGKVVSLGFVVNATEDGKAITLTTSLGCQGGILSPLVVPWAAVQQLEVLEERWHRNNVGTVQEELPAAPVQAE